MVDTEYRRDNYKSSKIIIRAIIKNPEILKFVPDYLKTKHMCNYAVKKITFHNKYVSNQCKIKKICNKAILKMLEL